MLRMHGKAVFIALAVLLLVADLFLGLRYGWTLAAFLLLGAAGWYAALLARSIYQDRERRAAEKAEREAAEALQRLLEVEKQRAEEERRLCILLELSRGMAEAKDEHKLMETALSAVTELVGALGCSFVPVDEWDQPLPAFTHGQLPEPVLRAWAIHLTSGMLRERCENCELLAGSIGDCPLHPIEVGNAMRVFCLPLSRAGSNGKKPAVSGLARDQASHSDYMVRSANRKLGVLHLYMPPGSVIDESSRQFLEGLLPEIALAYENAHLRSQEIATLRQLQLLHAPESGFTISLGSLLDGLRQALEADCVLVHLRPSSDERLSNLTVQRGDQCALKENEMEAVFTRVIAGEVLIRGKGESSSEPGQLPVWLALPLALPVSAGGYGENVLGMLMVIVNHPQVFHPRQHAILQTIAAQAALLVENERMIRSLEYKVLIQERARLAREIHDGLAQTLAFLKLQAAQMQSYLVQGDIPRLEQVLKDNYQALTEAYLDTRQAIDNLRLTPNEGLTSWIERSLMEFENSTNLRVERVVEPLDKKLLPEVQAHLIRIVQEALSNIRKHSRARNAWVYLRSRGGALFLEIGDDGQGFESDDVPEISHHGLRGMRERAEMIGADFQVISQVRHGTRVILTLPLSLSLLLEEEPPQ